VLVAAAMMAVGGGLMTAQKVVTATLRQQIVPRRVFGRVLSASRVVAMAGGPVGAGLGGVLAAATHRPDPLPSPAVRSWSWSRCCPARC
jgi:hypothetical protein